MVAKGVKLPSRRTNDVPIVNDDYDDDTNCKSKCKKFFNELRRSDFKANSPQNSIILMVFTLGSASMVVNTVLRSFFMDPVAQAHIAHRQREIGKMAQEARLDQNKVALDTAMKMREKMLPDQMAVQMGAFKPMMFTMIFIIAIFAWLASSVENFRVDYISLPWNPKWGLIDDKVMWFIPVWVFAYICMSAPLGRIIDRHIKLIRYKSHPIVLAGKSIKEPLVQEFRTINEKNNNSRSGRKRRNNTNNKNMKPKQNSFNSIKLDGECKVCGHLILKEQIQEK